MTDFGSISRNSHPVFLVGAVRSGTTVAQSLVGGHPDVLTFPETHFVGHAIGDHMERVFEQKLPLLHVRPKLRKIRIALGLTTRSAHKRMADTLAALGEPSERNTIRRGIVRIDRALAAWADLLDKITEERGRRVWLEKTPMHVAYIKEISHIRPNALFLHIFREPEAVVASMVDASRKYDAWIRYSDVRYCLSVWNRAIAHAAPYQEDERHLMLRYEDIVNNPKGFLKIVYDFIGLDPTDLDQILESRGRTSQSVIAEGEAWKEKILGPIVNVNKASTVLTRSELQYVSLNAHDIPRTIKI